MSGPQAEKHTCLVSACLLGLPCRYNGRGAPSPGVQALIGRHTLVPFCPEQLAGLPTPRPPAEICGGRVLLENGQDVTDAFERGAMLAVRLARQLGCTHALLKQKSPSCGCGLVYDGSFTGKLVLGNGLAAAALIAHGLTVLCGEDAPHL